jgi:hypothetical protein
VDLYSARSSRSTFVESLVSDIPVVGVEMKISELSESQYRKYFEFRLASNKFRKSGVGYMAQCCFHQDRTASLSINTEKGVWNCHAGCGAAGIIEFEKKFSGCDNQAAIGKIAEIIGEPQLSIKYSTEIVYNYTDVFGKLIFQVVRAANKKFSQRRPDGKGGNISNLGNIKKVLYRLPEVVTAKQVIICEGEKDADNLSAAIAKEKKYKALAVTTSAGGAGSWRDEYALYLIGKQVVVIPDNDDVGRAYAETVAASAFRYAHAVKVLTLPDLPPKGDVSDYLQSHTVEDLVVASQNCPWWRPPVSETSLFMTVTQFEEKSVDAIDWLVEGLIQRGSNGLMIARPKSGKSFAVLDLAIALASGQKWMDFYVPKRSRVALVSREDYYGLTQWRERKLRAHRGLTATDLDGWLYINAKGLRPKFVLDDPNEVKNLVTDLKRYQTEFLILDVMRVLHSSDENDNTEIQKIVDVLNGIQQDVGCSICMIHHHNKKDDVPLTERARGASAIAGYAEFICGIGLTDADEKVREFECELKASIAPDMFYWRITDTAEDGIKLERTDWTPPQRKRSSQSSSTATKDIPF